MPIPQTRVEIAFDLSATDGSFIELDDPVKGILGSTEYVLGGAVFYDVTDKVKSVTVERGKNRETDEFDPGLANIVFDNNDRTFDPEFADSPYFGQIIPKRQMRIFCNDRYVYFGVIDDWNINYESTNDSTASASASDAFVYFATQTLTGGTATEQFSGERINAILNDTSVNWPIGRRDIDTGLQTLGADYIEPGTNALQYLQLIQRSEPGQFFISKNGDAKFLDRTLGASSADIVKLSDNGGGIPFAQARVVYGSELLFNEIEINSAITTNTVVVNATESQEEYGILNLTRDGLLMSTDVAAEEMATFLAKKYADPEYRFESVTIIMNEISEADANKILDLDIGDTVEVSFTPNKIPPAINRYAEIIGIAHSVEPTQHIVTLSFASLDFSFWRLSDVVFGRLSAGNSLAY